MATADEKYWEWVRWLADRLHSDGCTGVADIYKDCCLEHDISYRTGLDPRVTHYKGRAVPISRAEADKRFRQCMQSRSVLGKLSPVSWVRWAGVRIGGWLSFNKGEK